MTLGSLFSGIGGLELGLERALGCRTVWQVERDPYARHILARHWPEVERFDDVRTVGQHNLTPVDLLCGGFPCQDLSAAGKGAGLEGARSGLWYEMRRIIDELRPTWVVAGSTSTATAEKNARPLAEVLTTSEPSRPASGCLLDPGWCESFMGFPPGWTAPVEAVGPPPVFVRPGSAASVTASSPPVPKRSAG